MHQFNPATGGGFSRRKFLGLTGLALVSSLFAQKAAVYGAESAPAASSAEPMPQQDGVFQIAPLPYAYDALEPYIDAGTMHFHHDKHYAAYTKNLNAALEKAPELKAKSIEQLLGNIKALPEAVRKVIRNNGGGYYNHSLFWRMMTPGGGKPEGELADALNKTFGSLEEFKKKLSAEAGSVFGSGWAWLVVKDGGQLELGTTPNQDSPVMSDTVEIVGKPILGIDVWEHAYYLKYKNERAKYIDAWWNVVNWKTVGESYAKAKA